MLNIKFNIALVSFNKLKNLLILGKNPVTLFFIVNEIQTVLSFKIIFELQIHILIQNFVQ